MSGSSVGAEDWYTTSQAARRLGMDPNALRRRPGDIQLRVVVGTPKRYLFRAVDVEKRRRAILEKLGALEPGSAAAVPEELRRVLEERDAAKAETSKFRAALEAQIIANQANLAALREFVQPTLVND